MMENANVWGKESKQMTSDCPLAFQYLTECSKENGDGDMLMTEKYCLSAWGKKGSMRSETYRDKTVDSGEEPGDKEKKEVRQKLNESEGMTEIKSGLTVEETGGNSGREKTLHGGKRKDGGGGGEEEEKNE